MGNVFRPGQDELKIRTEFGRGVHPHVIRLLQRLRVVPKRLGDEVSLVRGKCDGNAPLGARGQIHGADNARDAAVLVLAGGVVHGRGRGGGVAD